MKVLLKIKTDSYNSYPNEEIELMEHADQVYITLGDREISVNKSELLGAIKLLCEK